MSATIVVGWDGREGSRDALALGEVLAAATDGRLIAACVYGGAPTVAHAGSRAWYESLREEVERALAPVGDRAERVAVDSTSAARGLHDLAEAEDADLVVVGSSHRGPIGRVLVGSVGETLLHGGPSAIAVAPRGFAEAAAAPRVVAVGYDGEPEARVALHRAVELARATGARLQVVAVIPALDALVEVGTPPRGGAEDLFEARRRQMEDVVDAALGELGDGIDATGRVVPGRTDVLADLEGVDLLVLGSRGYGPLRRVLLGSTATTIVRRASCPVIVCPRAEG